MNIKKVIVSLLVIIAFVGMVIFGLSQQRARVKLMREMVPSAMVPIILVPGSSADQNRFDALIQELDE